MTSLCHRSRPRRLDVPPARPAPPITTTESPDEEERIATAARTLSQAITGTHVSVIPPLERPAWGTEECLGLGGNAIVVGLVTVRRPTPR